MPSKPLLTKEENERQFIVANDLIDLMRENEFLQNEFLSVLNTPVHEWSQLLFDLLDEFVSLDEAVQKDSLKFHAITERGHTEFFTDHFTFNNMWFVYNRIF